VHAQPNLGSLAATVEKPIGDPGTGAAHAAEGSSAAGASLGLAPHSP
jgi:hypothetical protein